MGSNPPYVFILSSLRLRLLYPLQGITRSPTFGKKNGNFGPNLTVRVLCVTVYRLRHPKKRKDQFLWKHVFTLRKEGLPDSYKSEGETSIHL